MKKITKQEKEANKQLLASFGITKKIQNVFVTPEMAKAFLETSAGNRDINKNVVAEYAYYMRSGQWGNCDSKITFDVNYCMNNGHHRCNGIVDCGIGQEFTIELDFENHEYVDNCLTRGFIDNQKMILDNNANKVNSLIVTPKLKQVVSTLLYHNKQDKKKPFQCDFRNFYKRYEKELIGFIPVLNFSGFKIGVYGAMLAACINGVEVCDLIEYMSLMTDGLDRTPKGRHMEPVVAWRDKVHNYGKGGGQAITDEMYVRTQFSLYKYLEGSKVHRSYAIEKYPISLSFLNDKFRTIYR